MATYTTPLRTLIEQPTQHRNDLSFDEKMEVGRVMLFDFDYPIFDKRYRRVFETNFINNFYDREIGFETEYLFKRRLQNWLRINMPYYSKLMESETLKFDPFINSEMNVTHKKTNDETSQSDKNFGETTSKDVTDSTVTDEDTTSDTTTNVKGDTSGESQGSTQTDSDSNTTTSSDATQDTENFKRDIHTDTPDTRLAITTNDGGGTVGYASTIDESKETGKQTTDTTGNERSETESNTTTNDSTSTLSNQDEISNTVGTRDETIDRIINDLGKRDFDEKTDGSINSVEDFVQHRYGKIGVQTYSKMLMEYRQSFLRIEREIFDEMNQLFMLVY